MFTKRIRESSFNMTGVGGWGYWNSKLEILAAPPLSSGSIFRSAPLSCWFWSIQIFGAPPPVIFSEHPFWMSKNFRSPPQYLHLPLVTLNELSLSWFYFLWNMHLGNYSSWLETWRFNMTHEEPELSTNIHDFTKFYSMWFWNASPLNG